MLEVNPREEERENIAIENTLCGREGDDDTKILLAALTTSTTEFEKDFVGLLFQLRYLP